MSRAADTAAASSEAGRRARVALMGEFSAGKSTLVNLLVGQEVAPIRVTATQAPPLWISHGEEPEAEAVGPDGRSAAIPAERCREIGSDEAVLVRLRIPARGLLRHDVIDTPGLSDPLLAEDVLERVVRLADVTLWCTSAMQAWRRSEHAAWTALPERVRRRGLLVVTHADRLTEREGRRVLARLEREAGTLFRDRVLVSATDAARARAQGPDGAALWEASGGARLLAAIDAAVSELEAEREEGAEPRERRSAPSVPSTSPVPARPRTPRPPEEPARRPMADAAGAIAPLRILEEAVAALPAAPDATALRALADRVDERAGGSGGGSGVGGGAWRRLLRAHDFEAADPGRLLRQMRGEVADFADGDWCDLLSTSNPAHRAGRKGGRSGADRRRGPATNEKD